MAFDKIGGLRALTKVPFMCLTASAPPHIESEIVESVGLINPVFVKNPINRANIYYCVLKKSSMTVSSCKTAPPVCNVCINWLLFLQKDLGNLAARLKDPKKLPKTIVFCRTKTLAAKVYLYLRNAASSQDAVSLYHATLTEQTKTSIYNTFSSTNSIIRCLCATVAFAMVSSSWNT